MKEKERNSNPFKEAERKGTLGHFELAIVNSLYLMQGLNSKYIGQLSNDFRAYLAMLDELPLQDLKKGSLAMARMLRLYTTEQNFEKTSALFKILEENARDFTKDEAFLRRLRHSFYGSSPNLRPDEEEKANGIVDSIYSLLSALDDPDKRTAENKVNEQEFLSKFEAELKKLSRFSSSKRQIPTLTIIGLLAFERYSRISSGDMQTVPLIDSMLQLAAQLLRR